MNSIHRQYCLLISDRQREFFLETYLSSVICEWSYHQWNDLTRCTHKIGYRIQNINFIYRRKSRLILHTPGPEIHLDIPIVW